jgi:hypothetical protein
MNNKEAMMSTNIKRHNRDDGHNHPGVIDF